MAKTLQWRSIDAQIRQRIGFFAMTTVRYIVLRKKLEMLQLLVFSPNGFLQFLNIYPDRRSASETDTNRTERVNGNFQQTNIWLRSILLIVSGRKET